MVECRGGLGVTRSASATSLRQEPSEPAVRDSPGGRPWPRWLRTREPGVRRTPIATPCSARTVHEATPLEALEGRLLSLIAGLRQQVEADRREVDCLHGLASGRVEGRLGETEHQLERVDRRLTELNGYLHELDNEQQAQSRRMGLLGDMLEALQTARGQAEADCQGRIADLQQDHRALAATLHTAAARNEELQRHHTQRLRPFEERLSALEGKYQLEPTAAAAYHGSALVVGEEPASRLALRDLESSLFEELTAIHSRCDELQRLIADRPASQDASASAPTSAVRESPLDESSILVPRRLPISPEEEEALPQRQHAFRATNPFAVPPSVSRCSADAAGGTPDCSQLSMRLTDGQKGELDSDPLSPEGLLPLDALASQPAPDGGRELQAERGQSLAARVAACEQAEAELRRLFSERSGELLQGVQAGFAETKAHLDEVGRQFGELGAKVRQQEEALVRLVPSTAPDEDVLRRVADIEERLCDNGAVVHTLRTSVLMVQQRLVDVKRSINSALQREVVSHCSPPRAEHAFYTPDGRDAAPGASPAECSSLASPELCPGFSDDSRVSWSWDDLAAQLSALTQRSDSLEDKVGQLTEKVCQVQEGMEERLSQLQESLSPAATLPEQMPEDETTAEPITTVETTSPTAADSLEDSPQVRSPADVRHAYQPHAEDAERESPPPSAEPAPEDLCEEAAQEKAGHARCLADTEAVALGHSEATLSVPEWDQDAGEESSDVPTAGPWSTLAHLSSALAGFEAVLHRESGPAALRGSGSKRRHRPAWEGDSTDES